ncbi:MAG: hypothetical protein IJ411_06275 [Oscillospiraceae bacterium]|nr:hypothetical protein [Oscillospiraceae bacterium]
MDLKALYVEIWDRIQQVDFSQLWKGFYPLKFALYNEDHCFFNGAYVEKTDDFLANTSIRYQGEYIAIWNVNAPVDPDILASKIIHEMFHAFQNIHGEQRFPNEMDALLRYHYSVENLSIKAEENRLLFSLMHRFDRENFQKLLSLRNYRRIHFSYEYLYEAAVEQIEGTATYVELSVLKQLSLEKYQLRIDQILNKLNDPNNLFPIRILSYEIGALLCLVLKENQWMDFEFFSEELFAVKLLHTVPGSETVRADEKISQMIHTYFSETASIIEQAQNCGVCIAEGDIDLLGINIYDARWLKPYIYSRYFVRYAIKGNIRTGNGNFVIELDDTGKAIRIFQLS